MAEFVGGGGSGPLSGVVRRDSGSIAGHLSFDKAAMGAEQAMALQTAAVAIALRSAIVDVKKAVEEVDAKVDDLQRRARASEIGEVVGLYRELEHVVERTQRIGHLLDADWNSVATARRDLSVSLEKLRAYATSTVRSASVDDDLPDRVKAVEGMSSDQTVGGTLQLITVAEHGLHLWHYLYVERVRSTDPQHVSEAVYTARAVLEEQHELDEKLVSLITDRVAELADVRPLEIHRRGSIKQMDAAMLAAFETAADFAERTRTPLPELVAEAARPGLVEARAEVRMRAIGARDTGVAISREAARFTAKHALKRVKRSPKSDQSDS